MTVGFAAQWGRNATPEVSIPPALPNRDKTGTRQGRNDRTKTIGGLPSRQSQSELR